MIAIVLGTRPEVIKLSPIVRELEKRKVKFEIIHTNQHFSQDMDKIFFSDLKLRKPDFNLNVGGMTRSVMISDILKKISSIYRSKKYKYVFVQGDTNTVLAASLAANFEGIPVGHIEAGLRSFDLEMPEEMNRMLTDRISTHLFCPTLTQKNILRNERISSGVHVVGNTIVDSVQQNFKLSLRTRRKDNYANQKYILLTLHRPSNVDNKRVLVSILKKVSTIGKKLGMKVLFPVHPRTLHSINNFKIRVDRSTIDILKPFGYLDMLSVEKGASLILTDSGGIQEEACILKVPCVTIRDTTERPETVDVGSNIVVGKSGDIIKAASIMLKSKRNWKNPYGNGKSSKMIIDKVLKYLKTR